MDVKMYKSILFIALLMIVVMPTFAQNVQIEYSEKINTDVPTQLSLKLDNKTYLKIDVQADLSSKKTAVFNLYTAMNGVVSKFDMGIPAFVIISKEGKILDVWSGYREGVITERINNAI